MIDWKEMVILWSFLVLLAIGVAEEYRAKDFEMKIDDGILKSFKQLKEIDELDLSNRGIKEIDDGVFENVNVKILNLESNEIFQLAADAFSGLGVGLEELNLGSNQIHLIDSSFVGLKNLKFLNFSNNPVEYLAAGEFAGIPHGADILVIGNALHTLSTGIFEAPNSNLSEGKSVQGVENDTTKQMNRLTGSIVSLAEKVEIFSLRDAIIDPDDEQGQSDVGRTIVCIEDSILKKVGILEKGVPLPRNCLDTVVDSQTRYLDIQNRGIQGIAKEWYQLQQIPISFVDLSNNNLTELSPELLNDLPEGVKIVDLSNNLIKRIKKDVFSNSYLRGINLKSNLIEDVEDRSFESSRLWVLYLSQNQISDISFAASLPPSLIQLYFDKNQIPRIPDGVFSRLNNLTQLDLSRNAITELQSNAFKGLTSLNGLDLERNKVSKIESGAFLGLKNLARITLSGNSIFYCESGAFDGLESLTSLHLSLNKFTNITKNNFGKLPATLLSLELEDNEISHIDSDVFVGVPKHTLKLSNNKLLKILPYQFKIEDLKELHLKNNSITEISQDSFAGLSAVAYITLSSNQISEIPRGILINLNALTTFDISRNPITKLKNGALYGISMTPDSVVFVDGNRLEVVQGGIFENV